MDGIVFERLRTYTKTHFLVIAFTGLHYTNRKRHKATMAGCFSNKTGDALLSR